MRQPFQLPAIYWGGFLLLVSLAIPGHAEPPAAPVKKPNLEQLAKLPASELTKIIENSYSPDKRFAVGVGSVDGSKPKWENLGEDEKGFFVWGDDSDPGNYLIDVKADRITGVLDASHIGTGPRYNHESAAFVWSEDGRWLTEVQSWKWHTAVCTVHRVTAEGMLGGRFDFRAWAEKIALEQLHKQAPKLPEAKRKEYAVTIETPTLANDGTVTAKIIAQHPKDEVSEFVTLSVVVKLEGIQLGSLSAKVIKAEPIKEEAAERSSE